MSNYFINQIFGLVFPTIFYISISIQVDFSGQPEYLVFRQIRTPQHLTRFVMSKYQFQYWGKTVLFCQNTIIQIFRTIGTYWFSISKCLVLCLSKYFPMPLNRAWIQIWWKMSEIEFIHLNGERYQKGAKNPYL